MSDRRYRNFYEDVLLRDQAGEFALLHELRVEGETVATTLALNFQGARYVLMSTFEAGDWKSCSPGNVMMVECIADSVARNHHYFDLTIGNEPYKRDFAATPRPLYSAIKPLSMKGLPYTPVRTGIRTLRSVIRPEAA